MLGIIAPKATPDAIVAANDNRIEAEPATTRSSNQLRHAVERAGRSRSSEVG